MGKKAKETITIKIKLATHERVGELIEKLTAQGWNSLGINRTDTPTFATVVEAAVDKLADADENT